MFYIKIRQQLNSNGSRTVLTGLGQLPSYPTLFCLRLAEHLLCDFYCYVVGCQTIRSMPIWHYGQVVF